MLLSRVFERHCSLDESRMDECSSWEESMWTGEFVTPNMDISRAGARSHQAAPGRG
jgi:hypothetical protein